LLKLRDLFGHPNEKNVLSLGEKAICFAEFFDQKYFPFAKATKRRSQLDLYVFDKHIRPTFGKKLLTDISSEDLDGWMTRQLDDGYKPATINKHSSMLNRMLNIAVQWAYLDKNPFKGVVIKKLPIGDHIQRFLTLSEIKSLLSACKRSTHPYLHLFVKLLLLTGARKSELRLAKWTSIDEQKGELFVAVSKSGRSRTIVLSKKALAVLEQIRLRSDALGMPITRDSWVFANPRTHLPYTSLHIAFFKARESAGLNSVRMHDLRHTYASLLINNGASIYEVQQLLGHYNISMTERYARLFPNTLQERVDIIADTLDFDLL
jgi:integrase|tara:strand:- start:137 stop:1096 length:960 start_codon:yes stop_codon:yes gene_type:complete